MGYSPWVCKELDTTEKLSLSLYIGNKGPSHQRYGFCNNHVGMWELCHKEVWALKNWCFLIVVLKKTLESPLECKEIKPLNLKGNQPWILIGRIYAEALILWPSDVKSRLIRKDPDAGKNWGQEEKEATADVMVEWHHWLKGHASEPTPGDS